MINGANQQITLCFLQHLQSEVPYHQMQRSYEGGKSSKCRAVRSSPWAGPRSSESQSLLPGKVVGIILWGADRSGGHATACRALASAIGGRASADVAPLAALLSDDGQMWAAARAL